MDRVLLQGSLSSKNADHIEVELGTLDELQKQRQSLPASTLEADFKARLEQMTSKICQGGNSPSAEILPHITASPIRLDHGITHFLFPAEVSRVEFVSPPQPVEREKSNDAASLRLLLSQYSAQIQRLEGENDELRRLLLRAEHLASTQRDTMRAEQSALEIDMKASQRKVHECFASHLSLQSDHDRVLLQLASAQRENKKLEESHRLEHRRWDEEKQHLKACIDQLQGQLSELHETLNHRLTEMQRSQRASEEHVGENFRFETDNWQKQKQLMEVEIEDLRTQLGMMAKNGKTLDEQLRLSRMEMDSVLASQIASVHEIQRLSESLMNVEQAASDLESKWTEARTESYSWRSRCDCIKSRAADNQYRTIRNAVRHIYVSRWRLHARDQQEWRAAERTVSRHCQQRMVKKFSLLLIRWREACKCKRRLRHQCETATKRNQKKFLADLLEGWCHETSHANLIVERFWRSKLLLKISASGVASAIAVWRAAVARERKNRLVVRRIVLFSAGRALKTWCLLVAQHQKNKRVLQRILQLSLAAAWRKWCEELEQERSRRRIVARFLSRISPVGASFHRWVDYLAEQRTLRNKLRWFTNASLTRAFCRWVEGVAAQRMLRRVLKTFTRGAVGKAFRRWEEAVDAQRAIRRSMALLMRGAAARVFHAWADYVRTEPDAVSVTQDPAARAFHRWRDAVATERILRRVIVRLRNAAVAGAFYTWVDRVSEATRLRHAVRRLTLREVHNAFDLWNEAVRELRVIRKVSRRFIGHCVSRAFERWQEVMRELQVNRKVSRRFIGHCVGRAFERWQEVMRELQVIRKVSRRFVGLCVGRAFERWQEVMRELQVIRKVSRRFVGLCVGRAFERWQEVIQELRVIRKVSRRFVGHCVGRALERWQEAVHDKRRLRHVVRRLRLYEAHVALDHWQEAVQHLKTIRRVLRSFSGHCVERGLKRWREATAARRGAQATAADRWASTTLLRLREAAAEVAVEQALSHWARAVRRVAVLRTVIRDANARALGTWRASVAAEAKRQQWAEGLVRRRRAYAQGCEPGAGAVVAAWRRRARRVGMLRRRLVERRVLTRHRLCHHTVGGWSSTARMLRALRGWLALLFHRVRARWVKEAWARWAGSSHRAGAGRRLQVALLRPPTAWPTAVLRPPAAQCIRPQTPSAYVHPPAVASPWFPCQRAATV